jgi:hypothetical protein
MDPCITPRLVLNAIMDWSKDFTLLYELEYSLDIFLQSSIGISNSKCNFAQISDLATVSKALDMSSKAI